MKRFQYGEVPPLEKILIMRLQSMGIDDVRKLIEYAIHKGWAARPTTMRNWQAMNQPNTQ